MNNKISFFQYLVNLGKINTQNLLCARTYGWGDNAFIKLEYKDKSIKKLKPLILAKKYLKDIHNIIVDNVNFNNAHHDRIGCSSINIYSLDENSYNKYKGYDAVYFKLFENGIGVIEIGIFSNEEMEYSYNNNLYELWHTKK